MSSRIWIFGDYPGGCPKPHHPWELVSLRGSNRNQRVETIHCVQCGEIRRRVWTGDRNKPNYDREKVLRRGVSPATTTSDSTTVNLFRWGPGSDSRDIVA